MRLVIRHLSTLCRSRRRLPFLLTIGVLLSIAFILFNINNHRQQEQQIKDPGSLDVKKTEAKPREVAATTTLIQKILPGNDKYVETSCVNLYINARLVK